MSKPVVAPTIDAGRFRTVLGHFPTGVAVVTAIDPDTGRPVGMAIGSFTSVSLSPPLVAFLPDRTSSTFPAVRASGNFCVNFLTADQEWICRNFARKGDEKFVGVSWSRSPVTGSPVVEGALSWLDCRVDVVHEAGDHYIVVGEVVALGETNSRLPLMFFQGGYGRFASLSISSTTDSHLLREVRYVDVARPVMEKLADATGLECLAVVHQKDELLILASSGGSRERQLPTRVGQRMPVVPPMGAPLVAWEGETAGKEWLSCAVDDAETQQLLRQALDRVRRRGWSLGLASEVQRQFNEAIEAIEPEGPTPEQARKLQEITRRITVSDSEPERLEDGRIYQVRSVNVPVFGPTGTVMQLTMFGFRDMSTSEILALRDMTISAADQVTRAIGGRVPEREPFPS